MALPLVATPKFDLTLPISKKQIKYRPYLVKEQKVILQAVEMGSPDQLTNAMRDAIIACTYNEIEIDKLPFADVEFILINIRAKSSGEMVELFYRCNSKGCDGRIPVQINLSEIEVVEPKKENLKIEFGGSIGIVMQYPTYKDHIEATKLDSGVDQAMSLIFACTKSVFDGEQVWSKSDFTKEDLEEFILNLQEDDFKKLNDYVDDLPQITKELHLTCPKCGVTDDLKLTGIDSFLD